MIRLKLTSGGEVNFFAHSILAFVNKESGSEVVLVGGLTYDVVETPLSIRNAVKKLENAE